MTEEKISADDVVDRTTARLAELGHTTFPRETIGAAWRDVLMPEVESRVGRRLTQGLSDEDSVEFDALIDGGDEDGASAWLDSHVPGYRAVVREELARMVDESVAWFVQRSTRRPRKGVA